LNDRLWGIKRREMTIISARPSHGKTAMMNQVAWDMASQGHKVLFLSLEMNVNALQERLFCHVESVNNIQILKGEFKRNNEIQNKWDAFEERVTQKNLVYSDSIGKTWDQINTVIESLKVKPDVIIIDHVNEIISDTRDRRNVIDNYIINLRAMAIKENFAVILGAQINRAGQGETNKEPQLHQLKESGKLEETADVALLLYWAHRDNKTAMINDFTVVIAKNRNGMTGRVELCFEPEYYRFSDLNDYQVKAKIEKQKKKEASKNDTGWSGY
jgi:replicative DNA helicase